MKVADLNRSQGVRRFSLVTSGRAMHGRELEKACSYYAELNDKGGISLCASMGLLSKEELLRLGSRESGDIIAILRQHRLISEKCAPHIQSKTKSRQSLLRKRLAWRCAVEA